MHVLKIVEEDFDNYKLPAMFIGTIKCGGKCCIEAGIPLSVCQNDEWRSKKPKEIPDEYICEMYNHNFISQAIVFGGLEPFEQFDELIHFIHVFRCVYKCYDPIIIYTGYNKDEIINEINQLKQYEKIIVKFGRYVPNQEPHFDEVLGVDLASDNQYAERISVFQGMMKIRENEDKNHVKMIREALADNDGYCPCSIVKNDDTKCMCKEFREQHTPGKCHCGLYEKFIEE